MASVRISIPDLGGIETAATGLPVAFLPYDRDSILLAMASRAPTPRPSTAQLDTLFATFRVPFQRFVAIAAPTDRLRRERDSLATLPGLESNPRFRAVDDSLTLLVPIENSARAELDRVRSAVGPSIDRLGALIRTWEDSTYRGYRDIVRGLGERVFANPVADTTDQFGWATIRLTDGRWWATASTIDPIDPHREWYWNVRIDGDTAYLNPRTGRNRPRY